MEYSPPPLFKQGASARAKMVFFALIALVLLGVDSRMRTLSVARQVISTALYPLQVVALAPRDALYYVGDYFTSLSDVTKENESSNGNRRSTPIRCSRASNCWQKTPNYANCSAPASGNRLNQCWVKSCTTPVMHLPARSYWTAVPSMVSHSASR